MVAWLAVLVRDVALAERREAMLAATSVSYLSFFPPSANQKLSFPTMTLFQEFRNCLSVESVRVVVLDVEDRRKSGYFC